MELINLFKKKHSEQSNLKVVNICVSPNTVADPGALPFIAGVLSFARQLDRQNDAEGFKSGC